MSVNKSVQYHFYYLHDISSYEIILICLTIPLLLDIKLLPTPYIFAMKTSWINILVYSS